MKNKKLILVILCLVLGLGIVGCSAKDISSKFVGSNNNDFEYIKENKVDKIVIQSTRDSGFRFLVKEKSVIDNIYSMLSKLKLLAKRQIYLQIIFLKSMLVMKKRNFIM